MNDHTRRQLMRQRLYREFRWQPDCRARVERELGLLQLFGFQLPVGWQFPTEKRRLWLNWRLALIGRRN